jgi:hypothetical protein
MPPWGAIKGFGEFRNDQGLTAEQLELITQWVDGGVPEGDLKEMPSEWKPVDVYSVPKPEGGITVSGDLTLDREFTLDGLWPTKVLDDESMQITAELPDASVEPLVWLYEYKSRHAHPFLLRTPIHLPAGTVIRGIGQESQVTLIPASEENR